MDSSQLRANIYRESPLFGSRGYTREIDLPVYKVDSFYKPEKREKQYSVLDSFRSLVVSPCPEMVSIELGMLQDECPLTFRIDLEETAEQLIKRLLSTFKPIWPWARRADSVVLKARYRKEYMYGDSMKMRDYDYISNQISEKQPIQLDLISLPQGIDFPDSDDNLIFSLVDFSNEPKTERLATSKFQEYLKAEFPYQVTTNIWENRHWHRHVPEMLPIVLQCIDWDNEHMIEQAYESIKEWKRFQTPEEALVLLDGFQDPFVRDTGLSYFLELEDSTLQNILRYLVKCLRFEQSYRSNLSEFLLFRAARSPHNIGHFLFWYLTAALSDDQQCAEHISVLLDDFSARLPRQITQLQQQQSLMNEIIQILQDEHVRTNAERLQNSLELLNSRFPHSICLPLDPRHQVSGIISSECSIQQISLNHHLTVAFKNYYSEGEALKVNIILGSHASRIATGLHLYKHVDRLCLRAGFETGMRIEACLPVGSDQNGDVVVMSEFVKKFEISRLNDNYLLKSPDIHDSVCSSYINFSVASLVFGVFTARTIFGHSARITKIGQVSPYALRVFEQRNNEEQYLFPRAIESAIPELAESAPQKGLAVFKAMREAYLSFQSILSISGNDFLSPTGREFKRIQEILCVNLSDPEEIREAGLCLSEFYVLHRLNRHRTTSFNNRLMRYLESIPYLNDVISIPYVLIKFVTKGLHLD